jgi:hypothetical protein
MDGEERSRIMNHTPEFMHETRMKTVITKKIGALDVQKRGALHAYIEDAVKVSRSVP